MQEGPGNSTNVEELQRQVSLYRRAIDDFQSDNRDTQAKAILDLDLVKRSDLTSALDHCKQLEQGKLLRSSFRASKSSYTDRILHTRNRESKADHRRA